MAVSPARVAAFEILLRVERESSYATELLHSTPHAQLSSSDHALATELVMGVLRWRSCLDEQIASVSTQALSKLDIEVLVALRLALYQFRWLSRIPERAAVHESVELIKAARKRSAASFVNAVLRKLAGWPQNPQITAPGDGRDSPENLASKTLAREFAHPLWLIARWADAYGLHLTRQICQHNQSVPEASIRLRTPVTEEELAKSGVALAQGAILASARRVVSGDLTSTPAFRASEAVIQDEASQLVAGLVGRGARNGARILDCCAAPGGKTLAVADNNPDASIVAIDIHPHRVRLMKKLLLRARSGANIQLIVADARDLPMHDLNVKAPFDYILADVPCSGTGTLSRHPEIKWRLSPDDLRDLQSRQCTILRSALSYLASGGRLVYSTCSLEKEENEDVVQQCLNENNSFRLLDCRVELERMKSAGELTWPDVASLTRGPFLRTVPGVQPCDGFFAAILEKV